jgi:hypothetical protein
MVTPEGSRPAGAEQRLKELGIKLPPPPEPFGTYVEAVQTGNLLFLSGMAILTNGKVTEDKVDAHGDLLAEFPYLGPPHSA